MNTITLSSNETCLVVEDSPVRIAWFSDNLPNFDIAETPDKALGYLDFPHHGRHGILLPYDVIFLDHDCRMDANGRRNFVEPTDSDFLESTYWRVAQFLQQTEYPATIVIHSGNPVGASRMASLLKPVNPNVFILPFGSFKVEIER